MSVELEIYMERVNRIDYMIQLLETFGDRSITAQEENINYHLGKIAPGCEDAPQFITVCVEDVIKSLQANKARIRDKYLKAM